MTGYRWSRADGKNYIIKLTSQNAFVDRTYSNSFYTTDCIIDSITDENGNEVDEIDGHAFFDFTYKKGQRIKDTRIYFCGSKESVMKFIKPKGRIIAELRTDSGWWFYSVREK